MTFFNRLHAGRSLAEQLTRFAGRLDVTVLALPRGGVPVAFQVARALDAPLDIFLVRKLGVPGYEELAMGAIASGGVRMLNPAVIGQLRIGDAAIERATATEQRELERREQAYRDGREAQELGGRTVILVDDGLATGATMRAAIAGVRAHGPKAVVVAVPVGASDTVETLRGEADDVVCVEQPEYFRSVGEWYEDFSQTTDEEVRRLLAQAAGAEAV